MAETIPTKMTAIEITAPGGPLVLKPGERSVPEPKAGELLIKVRAAGVNRPDVLQRQGHYPPPAGASDIPGLEIAGDVVAIGEGVTRFRAGERVTALVAGGGYAQYCVVHETNALPVPAGYGFIEAAAIPETFFTVWHNVFERGGLQSGETFLVHGGSSGIGTTAIHLAKAFGATVITTAGSDEKCEACQKLGADRAINYRNEDFVEAIKEMTGGKGVNLILDMVGGDYTERNYDAAALDGRIVQIAFLNGAKVTTDISKLMVKRLTHTGSTLRNRPVEFKAGIARELELKVWPLLVERRVAPVIDMIYPLHEAWRAHERIEDGRHIGKIVLDVS
ncbi:putative PIG3 family NAD(P)H quinone oxidoreductase [Phyllobacterium sp. 1468]|uniref:NAD(P)H-quinone oxidoreductase n=1 Tax=Phyllobacterium sp. 1468 TaxID=2817759 RepID=UPI002857A0A1|nr:NAD(P)H-quinone oxidoreductase [Phyllobacterium sp. 1468]MDR6631484.1 putative PIG3 family NAD(P)H quinone oxidoreductase [Phyllobacterium sp. 1468]